MTMHRAGSDYYYHSNRLGSTYLLTDGTGGIVERYAYSPYGSPAVSNSAYVPSGSVSMVGNPYMFTGREFDGESGLYNYRARTYDPVQGRFKQLDPNGIGGGVGLYCYCANNPVANSDPLGLQCTASVCVSPVLGTAFGHSCIQVEWDAPFNVPHYALKPIQVPHARRCGSLIETWTTTELQNVVSGYTTEVRHVVYAIELTRGGGIPQGATVFGTGPAGAGPLGIIPRAWSIMERPGGCGGNCAPVQMMGNDPCTVVRSIINSAVAVGAAATGQQYFLWDGRGNWLGAAANTCNSVTWSILNGAGVAEPGAAPSLPGWGHPMQP